MRQGGTVIVRISRGTFAAQDYEKIRNRLDESQRSLAPAIRGLTGCVHYWAAIDRPSNAMVNVSVWRSLVDAAQMDTLAPMRALASEFVSLGVHFELPIANHEVLWDIATVSPDLRGRAPVP